MSLSNIDIQLDSCYYPLPPTSIAILTHFQNCYLQREHVEFLIKNDYIRKNKNLQLFINSKQIFYNVDLLYNIYCYIYIKYYPKYCIKSSNQHQQACLIIGKKLFENNNNYYLIDNMPYNDIKCPLTELFTSIPIIFLSFCRWTPCNINFKTYVWKMDESAYYETPICDINLNDSKFIQLLQPLIYSNVLDILSNETSLIKDINTIIIQYL